MRKREIVERECGRERSKMRVKDRENIKRET
jgi:hypothetical protein